MLVIHLNRQSNKYLQERRGAIENAPAVLYSRAGIVIDDYLVWIASDLDDARERRIKKSALGATEYRVN